MGIITRIRNNQVYSGDIHANKLRAYTITGELLANNLVYTSTLEITGDVLANQDLHVMGNLYVVGNTTSVSSSTVTTADLNIILANGSVSAAFANSAGILIGDSAGVYGNLTVYDGSWLTPNNLETQANLTANNITVTNRIYATDVYSDNFHYANGDAFVSGSGEGNYGNANVELHLANSTIISNIYSNINSLFDNVSIIVGNVANIVAGITTLESVTTRGDATIGGNLAVDYATANNIILNTALYANANAGTLGQYLTSTGTGTYWATHFWNDALPPDVPNYGDIWYYIDENKLYMWVTDGASDFWFDFLPPTF